MSYILEALKKSEQERSIGHVPDLSVMQEESPRPRRPRWPWVLSLALLLNALLLVLFAWEPWESEPTRPVEADSRPAPTPSSQLPRVSAPSAPIETEAPGTSFEAPPPATALEPTDIPAAGAGEGPVLAQSLQTDPEDDAALTGGIPETPVADEDGYANVPRWEDIPSEQRLRLPLPRLDVHVFAQDPGRRFVMVDLKKYQEGDQLPQGMTLVAIRAEGIVLSYQGQRYRVERP